MVRPGWPSSSIFCSSSSFCGVHRRRQDVELDVRARQSSGRDLQKTAMCAADRVSRPLRWKMYFSVSPTKRAPLVSSFTETVPGLQPEGGGDDVVVLQVLADAGRGRRPRRSRARCSSAAGPIARELQQLRRVDRAAGQDHLGARPWPSCCSPFWMILDRRPRACPRTARAWSARWSRPAGSAGPSPGAGRRRPPSSAARSSRSAGSRRRPPGPRR